MILIVMPCVRAQAEVAGLPTALLAGEVRLVRLVLRNSGALPLRGVRAVCSTPDAWLPPDDADLAASGSTLDCLAGAGDLYNTFDPSVH